MQHIGFKARDFAVKQLPLQDSRLAILLFILTLIMRGPFISTFLYHWDSVQFAMGMLQYNVALHQPHPPGYILYVALGWIFKQIIGEANLSLTSISLLFSALFTVALFYLGRRIYSRKVGLVAAVLALFSPSIWFHGEVALSYILEAFMVTIIAWLAYGVTPGDKRRLLCLTLILGLTAGIRQNTGLFLLPLWVWSLWRTAFTGGRLKSKMIMINVLLLAAVTAVWAIPMIRLSGGLAAYLQSMSFVLHYGGVVRGISVIERGFSALQRNLLFQGSYIFFSLHIGIVFLFGGLFLFLISRNYSRHNFVFYLLWILPSVLFYTLIHVNRPGHIFTYLPALLLLTAIAILRLSDWLGNKRIILFTMLMLYCLAGAGLFFLGRQETSLPSLRRSEARLERACDYVMRKTEPAGTLILAKESYRHAQYYLGNYQVVPAFGRWGEDFLQKGLKAAGSQVQHLILFDQDLIDQYSIRHPGAIPKGTTAPYVLRR
ncbi:MAG: DUF2723 domain-containing protein [bacterium]|jgi:hypothetical protein|nr:DUF2723 domain-containing protein [bacterium]MDD3804875.1 DUF2723 domain-containing protein [bacterium]MDD4152669.1 DUF2723 domain-containing protein [bacterium]MDD4557779.1 DUF2723 domain-containing protein [bacterium]